MFKKIVEKIVNFWKWLKADKATWKKRITIALGIGVAFAAGSRLTQTTIVQVLAEYNLNPAVQTYFSLGNNILNSKNKGFQISIGKDGETYFLPELKIENRFGYFSILPKGIGSLDNANFDISATGTIKYEDDDNGIDYLFYFNEFGNSQELNGQGYNDFKLEIVLPSYTTSTFWFNATNTMGYINEKEDGSWEFEQYNSIRETNPTSTVMTIKQVVFIDANGQQQIATSTIEPNLDDGGLYYKIEVDDTWLQNATFPVRIDPSYLLSENASSYWANKHNLTRDSNGVYHSCYWTSENKSGTWYYQVKHATSTDLQTWGSEIAIEDTSYISESCSIAVDSSNYLHIVFSDAGEIKYTKFTTSWASPTTLSDGNTGYDADIAIDNNNNLYVVWRGFYGGGSVYNIRYIKYSGGSWGSITNITTITATYFQYSPILAIDYNDNPHIVWKGSTAGNTNAHIRYTKWNGSSWDSITEINTEAYLQASPFIAITSDNKVHLAWCGYPSTAGQYNARYRMYNGSSWDTIVEIWADATYSAQFCRLSVDRSDNVYVSYSRADATTPSNYQLRVKKKTNGSWGSEEKLTSLSSGNVNDSSPMSATRPNQIGIPITGFATMYQIGYPVYTYNVFYSTDFSFSTPKYEYIKYYDFNNSATSTGDYMAWKGCIYGTSTPNISINATNTWYLCTTTFNGADFNLIQSLNSTYATTSPTSTGMTTSTLAYFFIRSAQKYQFCIADNPKQFRNFTWEGVGYITGMATSSVTSTKAQRVALYIYDWANTTYRFLAEKPNATCLNSACTIKYTTTSNSDNNNLMNYFYASSSRWCTDFTIVGTEVWSDCRQDAWGTTLKCTKFGYDTLDGTTTAVGCAPQSETEDLYADCIDPIPNDVATGCFTGKCGGFEVTQGSFPWGCNWYWDGAQHSCPTCYGCPTSYNSLNKVCEAKSTSWGATPDYGCGGPCNQCSAGSCTSAPCEGYQCGCDTGETCQSGICAPAEQTCAQICGGANACTSNNTICEGIPGTPAGNSSDCNDPTPVCCCL